MNGAGKSSTFKMLTGDTDVTGGDAFLKGNRYEENFTGRTHLATRIGKRNLVVN